jgi:thioredoxin 1
MKKIVLILLTTVSIINADWFGDNTKKSPMLAISPFSVFKDKIGKEPLMIEFGSTSCHSCQIMGRTLYKMKQKYPNINIYFIDIYEDKEVAEQFGIKMIPTQKYLDKNGQVIDTHIGVIEFHKLEKKLQALGIL